MGPLTPEADCPVLNNGERSLSSRTSGLVSVGGDGHRPPDARAESVTWMASGRPGPPQSPCSATEHFAPLLANRNLARSRRQQLVKLTCSTRCRQRVCEEWSARLHSVEHHFSHSGKSPKVMMGDSLGTMSIWQRSSEPRPPCQTERRPEGIAIRCAECAVRRSFAASLDRNDGEQQATFLRRRLSTQPMD
jgi:hypothetical protein